MLAKDLNVTPQDSLLFQKCENLRNRFSPFIHLEKPMSVDVYKDFERLPEAQKGAVYRVLDFMESLVSEAIEKGINPMRDLQLTWYALRQLGLMASGDLFQVLEDTDCIEIYTSEGVQLYRNFQFFEYCSYSLEELMTYPFYELYERPVWLEAEMRRSVGMCLQEPTQIHDLNIPDHNCCEKRSRRAHAGRVHFKKICALKASTDGTGYTAFLVSSRLSLDPISN